MNAFDFVRKLLTAFTCIVSEYWLILDEIFRLLEYITADSRNWIDFGIQEADLLLQIGKSTSNEFGDVQKFSTKIKRIRSLFFLLKWTRRLNDQNTFHDEPGFLYNLNN